MPTDPTALHDTANAILTAARRLFVQHGHAGTSISDIATAAKVNKSLIYHHFGDKAKLWEAVKRQAFSEYAQAQSAIMSAHAPTAELLKQSGIAYFRHLQRHPDVIRLLAWIYIENDTSCNDLERAMIAEGVAKIVEAQRLGELRADLEPHLLLAAYLGMIQRWFSGRQVFLHGTPWESAPALADEQFLVTALTICFDGMRPRSHL